VPSGVPCGPFVALPSDASLIVTIPYPTRHYTVPVTHTESLNNRTNSYETLNSPGDWYGVIKTTELVGGLTLTWHRGVLKCVVPQCSKSLLFEIVPLRLRVQWEPGGSFPGGRAAGAWSWPLASISAEVMNAWRSNYTPQYVLICVVLN